MPELTPEPGLVIPYVYLWRREHEAGEESGRKTRPALIVLAVLRAETGKIRVAVAPITSQPPGDLRSAVEIPLRVKSHLGLDANHSWVICDEYNEFDWPGVDISVTLTGEKALGYIPDALLKQVRDEMRSAQRRGCLKNVPRTE